MTASERDRYTADFDSIQLSAPKRTANKNNRHFCFQLPTALAKASLFNGGSKADAQKGSDV